MSKLMINLINDLKNSIKDSINRSIKNGELIDGKLDDFIIEMPSDRNHGDLASNVAMVSARVFKTSPLKIANSILSNIEYPSDLIEKAEIAGPGFINFFFSQKFYASVLNEIKELQSDYGKCDYGKGKKVIVEFVSANPTGPMHLGNARGGALGDCLSSILQTAGYNVWREFYVNDAGNQIEKFGLSLDIRYQQIWLGEDTILLPEDSYHGDDIKELAQQFSDIYGNSYLDKNQDIRRKALVDFALPININKMKKDMAKYNINYDKWFHESDLYKSNEVFNVVNELSSKGLTYELDGAVWYKATKFGAEKDEVLIRKNGNPTYFASDIAYHKNKLVTREFDLSIDLWGADHHGHVARMKNVMEILGINSNRLDILLFQFVRLVKDGEIVRMSKRTGKAIQLSDLLDEVSSDAARFIFNMREANSRMDFDLDLAVKQDSQNPVYYVQYAHARICSIFKSLSKKEVERYNNDKIDLSVLSSSEEIDLIYNLAMYTNEIIQSAINYDPTKITRYVISISTLFHKFYNSQRVHCEDIVKMNARLYLCDCVRIVIKNILDMFKVSSPDIM